MNNNLPPQEEQVALQQMVWSRQIPDHEVRLGLRSTHDTVLIHRGTVASSATYLPNKYIHGLQTSLSNETSELTFKSNINVGNWSFINTLPIFNPDTIG